MSSPQRPARAAEEVVSRDRWFLDCIATHVFRFEGRTSSDTGANYQDYETDRKKRVARTRISHHQIKYRRIDA